MTFPRTLLKAWNLYAKKQLGQNFLSDPSTAEMIVARSKITSDDTILEIGAGLGALTIPLARTARKVYAVEKDIQLIPLLKNELLAAGVYDQVELLQNNILDIHIESLSEDAGASLTVMGNLPYNISSQILIRLIQVRHVVHRAVFMFQRELAERIMASPGNKAYGRLAVALQYCADVRKLADVKANLFFPKPKVDSMVLDIRFSRQPDIVADDEALFFEVVKAAFGQRRKTLRNALSSGMPKLDSRTIETVLTYAQIDGSRRAESLRVVEFVELSNQFNRIKIS
jgi:16S rRNA (adenine1518-N6/adenine1519-N6)-dimethyltransferase